MFLFLFKSLTKQRHEFFRISSAFKKTMENQKPLDFDFAKYCSVFTKFNIQKRPLYKDLPLSVWSEFDDVMRLCKEDQENFLEEAWQGRADVFWEALNQFQFETGEIDNYTNEKMSFPHILESLRYAHIKINVLSFKMKIKSDQDISKDLESPKFQILAAIILNRF